MSKMANLDLVLTEMINAGQKMIDAATSLREILSTENDPQAATSVEAPTADIPAETPAPEAKKYTFQEVRGIMASLAGSGKKAEAKALLTKLGAKKLSDVKEEDFPALVAEAEALMNG